MAEALPPLTGAIKDQSISPSSEKTMEITIHVCDEAKNVKKDFTCPRDLLLNEMKYFQEYLSPDTEEWDDVDISVHCDIKIFDWLIRYVKRSDESQRPSLDVHNAVSILISSDFLKIENLVEHCIDFCHENLSAIIATPCNMNCINDNLVTRIVSTFNQHQLQQIKDKKDKFKSQKKTLYWWKLLPMKCLLLALYGIFCLMEIKLSKLFCKMLEKLFDENHCDIYSPNNASKLFRCLYCEKMLIPSVQNKIECTSNRTSLDSRGNISYKHARDPNWDVSEFLLNLKKQVKTWRNVYWRLWSIVNFLECRLCKCTFPLCDFKSCLFHPQSPVMEVDQSNGKENKIYPCCNQPVVLFESISSPIGCEYRNHEIDFSSTDNLVRKNDDTGHADVYNELLNVIDLVCVAKPVPIPTCSSFYDINSMLKGDTSQNKVKNDRSTSSTKDSDKKDRKRSPARRITSIKKRPYSSKQNIKTDPAEEDNGTDEQGIFRVVIHQKDTSSLMKNTKKTWNVDLPSRLNQDMQRESDLKRMNELLKELRTGKNRASENGYKMEAYEGGIYHRIETNMRTNLMNSQLAASSSNTIVRKFKNTDRF